MTAPGPLGEEARALVEAARDWAVRAFPASHSAECQWCPVCRTVAALRSPEAGEKVAGAVTAAAGALAGLLDVLSRPPEPDARPGRDASGLGPAGGPPPAPAAWIIDIPLDPPPAAPGPAGRDPGTGR
jgi:hypothetical protein